MPPSLSNGRLGHRRRKLSRFNFGLEPSLLVAAVTEGLVLGVTASAQADNCSARQSKHPTLHIANCKLPLQTQGAIVINRHFCLCQRGLLLLQI